MKIEKEIKDQVLQVRISSEMKKELFDIANAENVSVARLLEFCFEFWKSNSSS